MTKNYNLFTEEMRFQSMIKESNIRALVLFNLLNSLRKRDKILGKPRILSFSPTR